MWKWSGHTERMDSARTVKQIYKSSKDESRSSGIPKEAQLDSVIEALKKNDIRSKQV